ACAWRRDPEDAAPDVDRTPPMLSFCVSSGKGGGPPSSTLGLAGRRSCGEVALAAAARRLERVESCGWMDAPARKLAGPGLVVGAAGRRLAAGRPGGSGGRGRRTRRLPLAPRRPLFRRGSGRRRLVPR